MNSAVIWWICFLSREWMSMSPWKSPCSSSIRRSASEELMLEKELDRNNDRKEVKQREKKG